MCFMLTMGKSNNLINQKEVVCDED
jgi:hypothetical protein